MIMKLRPMNVNGMSEISGIPQSSVKSSLERMMFKELIVRDGNKFKINDCTDRKDSVDTDDVIHTPVSYSWEVKAK
jgi:hypothetical protein